MYSIVPLLNNHFSLMHSFLLLLFFLIARISCYTCEWDNNNDKNDEVASAYA